MTIAVILAFLIGCVTTPLAIGAAFHWRGRYFALRDDVTAWLQGASLLTKESRDELNRILSGVGTVEWEGGARSRGESPR